jgi:hypothetical protein
MVSRTVRDPSGDDRTIRDALVALGSDRGARSRLRNTVVGSAWGAGASLQWSARGLDIEITSAPTIEVNATIPDRRFTRIEEVRGYRLIGGRRTLVFHDTVNLVGPQYMVRDGTERQELIDPADPTRGQIWVANQIEDPVGGLRQQLLDTVELLTRRGPHLMFGRGDVTVCPGETEDRAVKSTDNSWPKTRDGTGSLSTPIGVSNDWEEFGYAPTHALHQFFALFDSSAIPDTDVISASVFQLTPRQLNLTQHFTARVFSYDWGAAVDTGDWRTKAQLDAFTLLADDSTSTWVGGTRRSFTTQDETAFAAAIDKTGDSLFVLASDDNQDTSAPAAISRAQVYTGDGTGSEEMQLTITHAAGGGGANPKGPLGMPLHGPFGGPV